MRTKKLLVPVAAGLAALTMATTPALATGGDDGYRDGRRTCSTSRWSNKLMVFGLTADQELICFRESSPERARQVGAVSGLTQDTKLVGMDYRPANGQLYALGDMGGVYTLNTSNAQATLVSRLNVALQGASFGVDFNPAVDRLRVVSDTGQNLRANVDDGTTTVDGTLNYAGPPAVNPAPGIAGVGYTNNDTDPNTATTLYDIDSAMDQVAIQSPANSGGLAATGKLTVDTDTTIGFDIYSTIRNGTTVDVRGLAALTTSQGSSLYRITLFTGRASAQGAFKSPVVAIAIPLNQL